MRKIYLVFTRDNNQWVNEMVDYVFVKTLPKLFGAGLSTQITRFTGRTFEWYRFVDEMQKLQDAIVNKKLTDKIFSLKTQSDFLQEIKAMRQLIKVNPNNVKDGNKLLAEIKISYVKMYPFYVLALFVAGPWRERILAVHGPKSQKLLDQQFKLRIASEGLLKEITNFMRAWLDPKLISKGYPADSSRFLSVAEVEEFVKRGKTPAKGEIAERLKGFVYYREKYYLLHDFQKFLRKEKIGVKENTVEAENNVLKGSIAYAAKPVKGRVRVVLNSIEMNGFKNGMILVTPMTAPEYLPIMKKSAAIVTNEGGLTCHAAIVARELRKPCIIGTKIATKVFKDGDRVEVDATKGIVRKV